MPSPGCVPGGGGRAAPGGGGKVPPAGANGDVRPSSGLAAPMGGRDEVAGGGGKGELMPRRVDFPAMATGGGAPIIGGGADTGDNAGAVAASAAGTGAAGGV